MYPEMSEILPHRAPMVWIDAIIECDDESATSTKVFSGDDYGAECSKIPETVLIECLAQTIAAMNGVSARRLGRPVARGMLVGVDGFEFCRSARAGVKFEFFVRITRKLGPFVFAEGTVRHEGEVTAKGNLKFYVEENDGEPEETQQAQGQVP